ncbi:hypothetical protein MA5S0422_4998 [Mycobacteroides abscessus 5S-0422]|uniref:Uncharacterized protein n=1 Tax=Mycobacteroides abscessus subsp. bolletii 1513 TaxID=1299321 RepID=X8DE44_9MYCO|nr:hypothetical protein MA5S0422_4998 [Mycobacteroides abscessus 5S-0422]EIU05945.1 hypothetical protein MA5S0421_4079 [Mycobacteroides abscessus 5S-0421]EIU10236.1 hypothetical protein MA5S0304_3824 [Mycobacteroides abscessus 5S-0304]EIU21743.1 hypothetical protein MA5S0708_3752 [Mycobacteroides abscessus 5S-0708]EIU25807.1 hypothetical protein MA5S0817_3372 [Mycobacteroides abscessus 5S-0817]EIU29236.1 hypothetical protein MA5S1212_3507 [Mycobacteroides abscessus 5S-1212]EIU45071.1 hypothet
MHDWGKAWTEAPPSTRSASSAAMASRYQRQPPQQVLQNAKSGEDK